MPNSLHRLLHAKTVSLLESAHIPQLQNVLDNICLRGRSLDAFAFVAFQEHFAEDLQWLARYMNWKNQEIPQQNRTDYDPSTIDAATEQKLGALNEADLQIYEAALQLRARRFAKS